MNWIFSQDYILIPRFPIQQTGFCTKILTSKVYCSGQPPHGKGASNVFKLNKHFSVNWYVNYIGFPHLITTNTSSSIKITVGSRKLERLVRRKIKSVIPEECCLLGLNFVHRCTQGHILFQIKLHTNFEKKIYCPWHC